MGKYAIGIDLGGTKIEFALVDTEGNLLNKLRVHTKDFKTPDKIIDCIADSIEKISQSHPDIVISAVGMGLAGQIEKNTGEIINAPNLGWKDVNLQEQLTTRLGKKVFICNDVKAAAMGEWLHGAGVGCDNQVCIFIGTGIGGAIICNGKMLEGCNNTAGEIGHITIQMDGPVCHCGNKGCFEALAGGWATQRDAQAAVKNNKSEGKVLLEMAGGKIDEITGATVTAAAEKGDALANKILDNLTAALVAGIISVINLAGPCRVILGGGVIEGNPQLVEKIDIGVRKHALKEAIASLDILPAKLHNDSGVIGAAAFALQNIK